MVFYSLLITIFLLFSTQELLAQVSAPPLVCGEYVEPEKSEEKISESETNIITNETISEEGLTIPSLWWAAEQFDAFGGRLIERWIAYRDTRQIDIIVNRQLWSILDYPKRYQFMNQFGTVARAYQYNVRVFNQQKSCVATYICDFDRAPYDCKINFDPSGQTSLQVAPPTEN